MNNYGTYQSGGANQSQGGLQQKILGSGRLKEFRGSANIWALIYLPPSCLALILCLSLVGGCLVWLPFVLLLLGFLVFLAQMSRLRNNGQVLLGLLCLVAVITGFVVAMFANNRWLNNYRRIKNGASYMEIWPASSAETYNDGTTFEFVAGAKIDSSRTYGYLDSYTNDGTVYCVAPVSADPAQNLKIQFWAVGTDCCLQRSTFSCGEAMDPDARGAVSLSDDHKSEFDDAVKGAETAFGLTPNDDFKLVQWRRDPIKWTDNLWHSTQVLYLAFSGGYLLLSCIVGIIVNGSLKY